MLYERWRQVADSRRDEMALHDLRDGRRWTFGQLADSPPLPHDAPVCFPQGIRAGFILQVLAAWKSGRVVCPLEIGQTVPELAKLPSGIAHVKSTSATT
ncbi:MAG TPA: hypothetical protein VLD18_02030, partial [Verrucomicrobiae bacterium]|nr:hypothetical protein [Verrucomicrobiae bacterium]